GSARSLRVQGARSDRLCHLLRFLAVHAPVLELDHGVLALAAQALEVVARSLPQRALHDLVLDAHLVERALDAPARMALQLHPDVRAPMELHRHARTIALCGRSSSTG